jgi:hypothetical protein
MVSRKLKKRYAEQAWKHFVEFLHCLSCPLPWGLDDNALNHARHEHGMADIYVDWGLK